MTPNAIARIDIAALQHNLQRVREYAPSSKVLAVIKANGYGHGIAAVANALQGADAFAVGNIDEALALRKIHASKPVVVLQGIRSKDELALCLQHHFQPVIHSLYQLDAYEALNASEPLHVWVKIDTGMHRLGMSSEEYRHLKQRIEQIDWIEKPVTVMSHFACADEAGHAQNNRQIERFNDLLVDHPGQRSLCNSAGLVNFPQAHFDWVRPGIMLYGISANVGQTATEQDLKPVMTLRSSLIAINEVRAGQHIGYGATWQCPQDMRVGVIAIGYGDGYPRHAPGGTPVLIRGQRCPLVGRVSMDLLTVDLRDLPDAGVGDDVVLWGQGLPIEEIAGHAGTIAYELVCRLTSRVHFQAA